MLADPPPACANHSLTCCFSAAALDVTMLGPDGWEAALRLRKCPETSHIKVVLITAHDQAANPTQQRNVGAGAYPAKPFDPGEMIRVVRELASVTGATA